MADPFLLEDNDFVNVRVKAFNATHYSSESYTLTGAQINPTVPIYVNELSSGSLSSGMSHFYARPDYESVKAAELDHITHLYFKTSLDGVSLSGLKIAYADDYSSPLLEVEGGQYA